MKTRERAEDVAARDRAKRVYLELIDKLQPGAEAAVLEALSGTGWTLVSDKPKAYGSEYEREFLFDTPDGLRVCVTTQIMGKVD